MDNIIIVAVTLIIVGVAAAYLIKSKKKGVKCIGCPDSANCSSNSNNSQAKCSGNCGGCSCNCQSENN